MTEIAATVVSLAGAAQAVAPGGGGRALSEGEPVYPGEAVVTGPAGAVLLAMAGTGPGHALQSVGPEQRWIAGAGPGETHAEASLALPVHGGIEAGNLDSHAARESLFLADGRAPGLVSELLADWQTAPVAAPDLAVLSSAAAPDPFAGDITAGELLGVLQEALELTRTLSRVEQGEDGDGAIEMLEAAAHKVRGMLGPESPVDLLFKDENGLSEFFEPLLAALRGGEATVLGRLAAEIPGGLRGLAPVDRVLFDEESAESLAQAALQSVAESAADMAHEEVLSLATVLESVTEENLSGVLTLDQDGARTRVTVRGGDASAPGESSIWWNSGDPESGPWNGDHAWLRTGIAGYEPDYG